MQDRFKFRVWNKLFNIMTYNFMFGNFMQKSLEDYEKKDWVGLNYEPDYICFNNEAIEEDLVIMQCTGLKDKNGKLIYENDIVKFYFDNDEIIAVLIWDNDESRFYLNTTDYFKDKYVTDYEITKQEKYEVIGNIYQDSHLLEN